MAGCLTRTQSAQPACHEKVLSRTMSALYTQRGKPQGKSAPQHCDPAPQSSFVLQYGQRLVSPSPLIVHTCMHPV